MTSSTVFLYSRIATLLVFLLTATAEDNCGHGRQTFAYKPNPGRRIDVMTNCAAVRDAYNCMKPLAENYDPSGDFVDFDKFVKKYLHCAFDRQLRVNEYENGMNLTYMDRSLPGFYLQMSMKNIEYGNSQRLTNSAPEVLLVKKFHNQQLGEYVKSEVMQTVERTQTTSNTVDKGFSTSASVEAGISTPFVEASVKAEVNVNLDSSNTATETHTRTLSLTDTIVVPPNSTVKLVWSISQSEMSVPWTGQLEISGWIPVKLRGEWWFVPVGNMATFFEEFFEFEHSSSMVYHTGGNFRGVTAVDSHVDTIEMPLHDDDNCKKNIRG